MARADEAPDAPVGAPSGPGKPLLQGHLRKKGLRRDAGAPATRSPGGQAAVSETETVTASPGPETPPPDIEPDKPRTRGRKTRSPSEVATRRHLEGAEQGPM